MGGGHTHTAEDSCVGSGRLAVAMAFCTLLGPATNAGPVTMQCRPLHGADVPSPADSLGSAACVGLVSPSAQLRPPSVDVIRRLQLAVQGLAVSTHEVDTAITSVSLNSPSPRSHMT